MSRRLLYVVCVVVLAMGRGVAAQEARPPVQTPAAQAPSSIKIGTLDLSLVWRSRFESWRWFDPAAGNNDYAFLNSLVRVAVAQAKPSYEWRLEAAQPTFLSVPDDAMAPPPQGVLGLGGSYYGANEATRNRGTLFLKQAFIQFKQLGRASLKVGRFEFFDGTEARISDPTVAGLVQSRVAHRLLSNEAFPAAQRSVDGGVFAWNAGVHNVTGFAARPTSGGVHLNGWKELDIEVYYGAYNRDVKTARGAGAFRVFGVGYADHRDAVVKPDNRPAPVRSQDRDAIALATFGASYVHVFNRGGAGRFDVIGWAAGQTGSWGMLSHRAASVLGEIGWQPAEPRLKPWLRGGYRYSSGDDDPLDDRNGTFYQVLGATRQYARFPFYNLMNLEDTYGMFAVRPSPRATIRSEVHSLSLASGADLWYGGGGPGQSDAFGYAGRPSRGATSLAFFWDVSADTQITRRLGLNVYYGRASGGDVIEATYPAGATAHFGYLETVLRF